MNSQYQMPRNAKIRLEAEVGSNKVVLEGTARDVSIDSEHSYDSIDSYDLLDSAKIFREATTTTINAELQEGWNMKVTPKDVIKIRKTATLTADDCTVPALERARKLAEAPKNAKFRIVPPAAPYYTVNTNQITLPTPLDKPEAVAVEFRWEEEK